MMNWIWLGFILISVLCGAATGRMEAVTQASIESAKSAVELALGLIRVMAFWLGVMKVAEHAGMLVALAQKIRPLMRRLFPEVPDDHPALSSMIMNISANMLGLGNAATPFGIKAMMQLNQLNPKKGVASDPMCLFLAINTSNVAPLLHHCGHHCGEVFFQTRIFRKSMADLSRYRRDVPNSKQHR